MQNPEEFFLLAGHRVGAAVQFHLSVEKDLGCGPKVSSQVPALLSLAGAMSCCLNGVGPHLQSSYYVTREAYLKASVCSRQGALYE